MNWMALGLQAQMVKADCCDWDLGANEMVKYLEQKSSFEDVHTVNASNVRTTCYKIYFTELVYWCASPLTLYQMPANQNPLSLASVTFYSTLT